MKKNATITLRLDVSDEIRLEHLICRCKKHPWIINPSKSEVVRYAIRFLLELDDASFYRVISNRGIPKSFEIKMKTE